jgi:type II secretory pathway pseudopilin PulG
MSVPNEPERADRWGDDGGRPEPPAESSTMWVILVIALLALFVGGGAFFMVTRLRTERAIQAEMVAREAQHAAAAAERAGRDTMAAELVAAAKALHKAGATDEAKERLRKLIADHPNAPAAAEARQLLEQW